jgi:hypothetical protein
MNQCWITYIRFMPIGKILTLYFLLTFSGTKLTVVQLWILSVSMYPLYKLETLPPLTSVVSKPSPSTWCVTTTDNICISLDVFVKHNISFRIFFIASGLGLSSLYCGHFWPIVPAPDDRWGWLWSSWWMKFGRGNRSTWRIPAPAPLYPPQILL